MYLNGNDLLSGDKNSRLMAWKQNKLADSVAPGITIPVPWAEIEKKEFHEKAAIVYDAAEDHAMRNTLTLQINDDIKN
jgi:hypothetical protein